MKRHITRRFLRLVTAALLVLAVGFSTLPLQGKEAGPVQLQLDITGPGQVDHGLEGDGPWMLEAGTDICLAARPDQGARFAGYRRNGQPLKDSRETLRFVLQEDTAIQAVFEELPASDTGQEAPEGGEKQEPPADQTDRTDSGSDDNREESGSRTEEEDQDSRQPAAGLNRPMDRPYELTEEESALIDQYRQGRLEAGMDYRKELTERYGLQAWVDDQWFLLPAYFETFGLHGAVRGGMQVMNRNYDGSRQQSWTKAAGTVTAFDVHTWHYAGGFMEGGLWTMEVPGFGQRQGYCANGIYAPPGPGTPLKDPVLHTGSMLRKALYYGYGGPENRLGSRGWNTAQQIIVTNDLVSMANVGTSIGSTIGGGWIWQSYSGKVWEEMKSWPEPPATFFCYVADTEGSGENFQGLQKPYQPLAFYMNNPAGTLRLEKSGSLPELTQDNQAYSLAGAEYTVYDTAGRKAGVLVTDRTGRSGEIRLPFGTYTCRETKAPAGYQTDPAIHTVTIDRKGSSLATLLQVSDTPVYTRASLLLLKRGDSSQPLADAEFEFTFHKNGEDAPARRWILKSDSQGRVMLDDGHKVQGDPFYLDEKGQPCFPRGEVRFREVKAPAGYVLDGTVHKADTTQLTVWNTREVENRLLAHTMTLIKKSSAGPELEGAVFGLFEDEACTDQLFEGATGSDGTLELPVLQNGRTYWLKELQAPAGYRADPAPVKLSMQADAQAQTGSVTVNDRTYQAPWQDDQVQVRLEDGRLQASLVRINQVQSALPETGSSLTVKIIAAAGGFLILAWLLTGNRKDNS